MKGFYDLDTAYAEVRKAFPGEVATFCCDLGESWLFKFVPKEAVNQHGFINGYFGMEMDKKSGKVRQYNMMENIGLLTKKVNLAAKLKN